MVLQFGSGTSIKPFKLHDFDAHPMRHKGMNLVFRSWIWCVAALTALTLSAHANQLKCTSTPCANTATGEDPGQIAVREVEAEKAKIRAGSDDKLRWETISLFSSSEDANKLKFVIHAASATQLELKPAQGLLSISRPDYKHTFEISPPLGATDNPCPSYRVEVLEASKEHAIIRKVCPKYESGSGRVFKGYDYYLYDQQTATMRSIWSASAIQDVHLLKSPNPAPTVTPTASGYKYMWKGTVAMGGSMSPVSYNNAYERQRNKQGALELVCRDMSAGKRGEIEGGSCEGGILPPPRS